MVGVLVFTGMFFGAFGWARLADIKGRRNIVIVTNIIVAVFGTLTAFAPNIYWLLFFRVIVGVGIAGSAVSYTLFAEYCPNSSRGKALMLQEGFWSGGALLSVLFAWITLGNMNENIGWRWYIGLSSIPCWVMVMSYSFIPESARYYSANGQRVEAEKMIRLVFKQNGKPYPQRELVVSNWEEANCGNTLDLFRYSYRTTSAILLSCFFATTFCYYGICFVSERLFKEGTLFFSMFITTLSEVPGIFLGAALLDRMGRKGMMTTCWFFFTVTTMIITLNPPSASTGDIQRAFDLVLIFVGRCAASTQSMVIYVYFSEYYPTIIRTTALGIGSSLGRIGGITTSIVAADFNLVTAMMTYSLLGGFSFFITIMLPQDTTGGEMKDQLDKSDCDMSWYSRHKNEGEGDEVRELSSGIKGKFQQYKAHAKSPLSK